MAGRNITALTTLKNSCVRPNAQRQRDRRDDAEAWRFLPRPFSQGKKGELKSEFRNPQFEIPIRNAATPPDRPS